MPRFIDVELGHILVLILNDCIFSLSIKSSLLSSVKTESDVETFICPLLVFNLFFNSYMF